MVNVVGIRFKKVGKIYYFEPQDLKINKGDYLIVETARGIELGECVIGIKEISEEEIISPLKKVLRIATEEDILKHKENKDKEVAALEICLKKIEEHNLNMKLIDVEYTFDNNKVIFYFKYMEVILLDEINKNLLDRLDFIEFKQNIIFLKPPQHSTQLFYELTLEYFLKIRDFTNSYIIKVQNNENTSLSDFEKKLIDIWPPVKSYPLSAALIAKILMGSALYNKLVS